MLQKRIVCNINLHDYIILLLSATFDFDFSQKQTNIAVLLTDAIVKIIFYFLALDKLITTCLKSRRQKSCHIDINDINIEQH